MSGLSPSRRTRRGATATTVASRAPGGHQADDDRVTPRSGQTVVFDIFGVVLREQGDAGTQALERLAAGRSATFWDAYWSERPGYDTGAHTAATYWAAVFDRLGLVQPPLGELVEADVLTCSEDDPETVALVEELARDGWSLALLSNIPEEIARHVVRRPWVSCFGHVSLSCRTGLAKPDPAVFEHVRASLAARAGDLTLIDDRQANVDAAVAAGWAAVRFASAPQARADLGPAGPRRS
ncbi:HAD-IA family hydrolase [Nocardioides litoris]|uniref:HAD-IA family hydrolase n=1 Tax=Nocardioides litoris TaxID=1926648 RepID=UPI0011203E4F|nr:HAD-IA family hydrolase [Nocardioides litoris]